MRRSRAILALVLLITAALPPLWTVAAIDQHTALLPAVRDDVAARTDGILSEYELTLAFDPATSTIGGRQRIAFVNAFDEPLDDIAFRLYPNAFYYDEGRITVSDARVAGERVEPSYEAGDTAMRLPLTAPLAPGASINLSLRFETIIPADSDGTYGIFSHDTTNGTWILADWYPIIAGWEPDVGWRLEAPTPLGDPTFSEAAFYDVTITAPAALDLVTAGSVAEETTSPAGERTTRIVTGPAREFTLTADDDYTVISATVDQTLVSVYVNPETAAGPGPARALDAATRSLAAYAERYGPYPYRELDIVETELAGALGVSWSGLIFLDSADFLASSFFTESDPTRLDFTVAHEVGHQWWGAMIGANSNDHTFLVEGLTNYLAIVQVADTLGPDAARRQLAIQIAQPYLAALDTRGDGIVDIPITDERNGPPGGALTYGKAALGFLAIRLQIGDAAFFAALGDYAERFAFRIAEPDDLLGAFETASGAELDALWRLWFNAAATTRADVEALIARAP